MSFPKSGCPAVIRIKSPSFAKPDSLEKFGAQFSISSIDSVFSSINVVTPRVNANFLAFCLVGTTANIGTFGRYLAINFAVLPDFV